MNNKQAVAQTLNDMEDKVADALAKATERLRDLDRTNDGLNAVIIPAWVIRTLIDKIIYDQHFMELQKVDDDE